MSGNKNLERSKLLFSNIAGMKTRISGTHSPESLHFFLVHGKSGKGKNSSLKRMFMAIGMKEREKSVFPCLKNFEGIISG
jgi:hypothetical protein